MNLKWIFFSLFIGLILGLFSYFLFEHTFFSLTVFIASSLILIYHSPHARYIRFAQYAFGIYVVANSLAFGVSGNTENFKFFLQSGASSVFNIGLITIILFLCYLDYIERTPDGTFAFIHLGKIDNSKNKKETKIQKNHGTVNQIENHGTVNQIENATFIIEQKEVKETNFDKIQELIEERRKLTILAENDPQENYISKIQETDIKLKEERNKIQNVIDKIQKYSSEGLVTKQIKQARDYMWKGNYSSASDLMIEMDHEESRIRFLFDLGIPPEYIHSVDYEIEIGSESSEGMIYNYLVTFSEDSPDHILREIDGIEESDGEFTLLLPPWEIENDEIDYDFDPINDF